MGDAESALPSSKKRVAGRQLSKDNPDPDDDASEPEMGTFQRASEEVMSARRIVKVQRQQPASSTGSNPFAGVRLVPPTDSSAKTTSPADQPQTGANTMASEEQNNNNEKIGKSGEDDKEIESGAVANETEGMGENNRKSAEDITDVSAAKGDEKVKSDAKEEVSQPVEIGKEVQNGGKEAQEAGAEEDRKETEQKAGSETETAVGEECVKEKQENEQKNATVPAGSVSSFQQLSSSQNAFTGLAGTGFSKSSFSFGSIAKEGSAFGSSSGSPFGLANNGSSFSSLLGAAPDASKSGKFSLQEVPIETGEENEKAVFTADAILYEYLDGGWKERGKGELKVNVSLSDSEKARLIMRARGNYRLILNASVYPDMSLASMDKRGITFACVNSAAEGKNALTTFALKFKDSSMVEEFRGVVTAHKGKKDSVLKTPENSPKASDD